MDSWEEITNSQKTQLMNQTKFCPVQDQVLSNNKICQNPIMPDEEEGFNSLVIYFFFPVLALTAILLVSLSYIFLPTHLRICVLSSNLDVTLCLSSQRNRLHPSTIKPKANVVNSVPKVTLSTLN